MNIYNTRLAAIASTMLAALTGAQALRSVGALAKAAGCTESEAAAAAQSLGLVAKRRRSDGATLYGIASRVNEDVQPTQPVPTYNAHTEARDKVEAALRDSRWTSRSLTRLKVIGNVDGYLLAGILTDLGAVVEDGFASIER